MQKQNLKSALFNWLEIILETSIVIIILYFLFWPIIIEGSSMESTFSSGNKVIISRIAKYSNSIKRGDIILCKLKKNDEEIISIKRVIGLPGDTIYISSGKVYVNNELLNETYINEQYTSGNVNMWLNANEYFVMGDNRDSSYDSRLVGAINKNKLIGKVLLKWTPLNEYKDYL